LLAMGNVSFVLWHLISFLLKFYSFCSCDFSLNKNFYNVLCFVPQIRSSLFPEYPWPLDWNPQCNSSWNVVISRYFTYAFTASFSLCSLCSALHSC
jgi:hypothetical protein